MNTQKIVKIVIDGETYALKLSDKQDIVRFKETASLVQTVILQLREKFPSESYHRLLLLACLQLCDKNHSRESFRVSEEKKTEIFYNETLELLAKIEKKMNTMIETSGKVVVSKDENK